MRLDHEGRQQRVRDRFGRSSGVCEAVAIVSMMILFQEVQESHCIYCRRVLAGYPIEWSDVNINFGRCLTTYTSKWFKHDT